MATDGMELSAVQVSVVFDNGDQSTAGEGGGENAGEKLDIIGRQNSTHNRTIEQRKDVKHQISLDVPDHRFKKKLVTKLEKRKTRALKGSRNVGGRPPHHEKAYLEIESVDYSTADTAEHTAYAKSLSAAHRRWRGAFLWIIYFAIGISIGVLVNYTLRVCDVILTFRVYKTKDYLNNEDLGMAWAMWVGSSLLLSLGALFFVLLEPAAASSGIPALLGYLNGVVPKAGKSFITGNATSFLSWETMLAKLFGMMLSIPSGLCIGPEGPIIHISALLARWAGKSLQYLENKLFPNFVLKPKKTEARDFLATGGACGIAAAFRAPLSGVLFVVEEASSHINVRHIEWTFLACIMTYVVGFSIYQPEESFSKFKQPTGKFCSKFDRYSLLFMGFMAIIGGVVGAAFNQAVEICTHWRVKHVNHSALRRMLEVTVVVLLTGSVSVLLPAAWPCREMTPTLMVKDSMGCMGAEDHAKLFHSTIRFDQINEMFGKIANMPNASAIDIAILENSKQYRVPSVHHASGKDKAFYDTIPVPRNVKNIKLHYPHPYTCKGKYEYNEMAGLWLNGGLKATKTLMERGFPTELSADTLIVFFIFYFLLAMVTAGISVPAGLVIPMMCMGGSLGRLVGLLAMEAKKGSVCPAYAGLNHTLATENLYYWAGSYRWKLLECDMPDPGTYAVIGMAAFMGGSGRITVMLAAILLELTGDPKMIAPIGATTIVSMIVGNFFNHGLYHGLIPLFNLPYLNAEPSSLMWISKVEEVMSHHVITIVKLCPVKQLEEFVERMEDGHFTHNAFPVVSMGSHLEGIITREQLHDAYEAAHRDAVLGFINLENFMERSPLSVYPHTRLGRAYEVFQKMQLRHLTVTNKSGHIVGMLTRKNLQDYKIQKNASLAKIQAVMRGKLARIRTEKKLKSFRKQKTIQLEKAATREAKNESAEDTPTAIEKELPKKETI
jgi:chloride channel 7